KETIDIMDVKCYPEMIGSLRKEKGILPAYHMNKEHWLTLLLDGSIEMDSVFELLNLSYELTE
ncbi:MAG: MmcQ/YjbR family DNA-binding protein, partial [Eubacterium sp.]|nr:MmcQ/YjbR family DNA-binding protein [Eubacterium sp.]